MALLICAANRSPVLALLHRQFSDTGRWKILDQDSAVDCLQDRNCFVKSPCQGLEMCQPSATRCQSPASRKFGTSFLELLRRQSLPGAIPDIPGARWICAMHIKQDAIMHIPVTGNWETNPSDCIACLAWKKQFNSWKLPGTSFKECNFTSSIYFNLLL